MRQVVALGGNALLRRKQSSSAENQQHNAVKAATSLARYCEQAETVIVPGNGPQVGLLALQAQAYKGTPPYPLDVLGAESQGMIGYVLAQAFQNVGQGRPCAALLTRTLVNSDDPAFLRPSKPIGPIYTPEEAGSLAQAHGWRFVPDGTGQRRAVASPNPVQIIEQSLIAQLISTGALVICAGGGGVPVVSGAQGRLSGVEAVIDKDLVAALLAIRLRADHLVILTDVDAVYRDWGRPDATPLRQLRASDPPLDLAEGSMAPKVRAARQFVSATGRHALIGSLDDVDALLAGRSGTRVTP